METLGLSVDGRPVPPFDERSPTPSALHYTADLLQCTTASTAGSRVDYLVVERIARDIRNQYIASLLRQGSHCGCHRYKCALTI
jgi:hypothetical protein